ncbi:hypothetical protein RFI_21659 [Reticulomyxa filosa]|uniref:Transmembrane protein n=1 Tax=Reticulomyxa filosa TaxID=46433 RepID=X6MNX5_RETFI|nr:hypothetical protein RFI_21659 [Reticulomyxa filosa]|eukprot:ETO15703.1 hypothetical protein RFI_21659 [Reticulomyxa filosa]
MQIQLLDDESQAYDTFSDNKTVEPDEEKDNKLESDPSSGVWTFIDDINIKTPSFRSPKEIEKFLNAYSLDFSWSEILVAIFTMFSIVFNVFFIITTFVLLALVDETNKEKWNLVWSARIVVNGEFVALVGLILLSVRYWKRKTTRLGCIYALRQCSAFNMFFKFSLFKLWPFLVASYNNSDHGDMKCTLELLEIARLHLHSPSKLLEKISEKKNELEEKCKGIDWGMFQIKGPNAYTRPVFALLLLISIFLCTVGVMSLILKLSSLTFVASTSMNEWSIMQWYYLFGFINQLWTMINTNQVKNTAMLELLSFNDQKMRVDRWSFKRILEFRNVIRGCLTDKYGFIGYMFAINLPSSLFLRILIKNPFLLSDSNPPKKEENNVEEKEEKKIEENMKVQAENSLYARARLKIQKLKENITQQKPVKIDYVKQVNALLKLQYCNLDNVTVIENPLIFVDSCVHIFEYVMKFFVLLPLCLGMGAIIFTIWSYVAYFPQLQETVCQTIALQSVLQANLFGLCIAFGWLCLFMLCYMCCFMNFRWFKFYLFMCGIIFLYCGLSNFQLAPNCWNGLKNRFVIAYLAILCMTTFAITYLLFFWVIASIFAEGIFFLLVVLFSVLWLLLPAIFSWLIMTWGIINTILGILHSDGKCNLLWSCSLFVNFCFLLYYCNYIVKYITRQSPPSRFHIQSILATILSWWLIKFVLIQFAHQPTWWTNCDYTFEHYIEFFGAVLIVQHKTFSSRFKNFFSFLEYPFVLSFVSVLTPV